MRVAQVARVERVAVALSGVHAHAAQAIAGRRLAVAWVAAPAQLTFTIVVALTLAVAVAVAAIAATWAA